jgi:hypothetical protein
MIVDCCGFHRGMSRRNVFQALGGAAAVAGLAAPSLVRAASHAEPAPRPANAAATGPAAPAPPAPSVTPAAHAVEALLLTCMDFRLQNETVAYMDRRGLRDKYDHIVLAGASLGVLTDQRPEWGMVFWDHLETAIALHHVRKVIVLDHLDCGAYKLFLGEAAVRDPVSELTAHSQRLRLLRSSINQQNSMLEVELGVMALDGSVRIIT